MSSIIECKKCLLNNIDDVELVLDSEGICNYCLEFERDYSKHVFEGENGRLKLESLLNQMRLRGKKSQYDCLLGVSGGVDSSYLAYLAKKEWNLRVLCLHVDTGWDSETAVNNINNIIGKLNIDLYTYVIDWEEMRDLQICYFKAGVIDLDIPTDYGCWAVMNQIAKKFNIKYIISGNNFVTESILPKSWIIPKFDTKNLVGIHNKFGQIPLKKFPKFHSGIFRFINSSNYIEKVAPLNYINYNKEIVKKILENELGWKDYGGKHYESIFTRFYQGYILPKRYGIDKRKAHLSNLICSNQITKEQAIEELKKPIYNPEQCLIDKDYVLKKLGFSEDYFNELMGMQKNDWRIYGQEIPLYIRFPFLKMLLPVITLWRRWLMSI